MPESPRQPASSGVAEWPPGPDAPALTAAGVQVWRSALTPDPDRRRRFEPLLSVAERARAARFRFDHDAHRYVIARGLLRTLLGRYLARAPEDLRLEETSHGRPFEPASGGLDFNLSHAGDCVVLAFARCGRVGIDVERIQALPDMADLVEINFSAAEQKVFRGLPDEARERAFFDCWTRKEAFVKAIGEGLSHPLDAFDVTLAPTVPPSFLRIEAGELADWSLHALDVAPGYAAALAIEAPSVAIERWSI